MTGTSKKFNKLNSVKFAHAKSLVHSRRSVSLPHATTKRLNKHSSKKKSNKTRKFAKKFFITFFSISFLLIGVSIALLLVALANQAKTLPSIDEYIKQSQQDYKDTIILDRNMREIYRVRGNIIRERVSIDEVPLKLQWAFLAIEDKQFWEHNGLNLIGITRAVTCSINESDIKKCGGGSSITQQLVKITTGNNQASLDRKVEEALTAIKTEQSYTKREILEYYLNVVAEGSILEGVKAGSKYLFGKENLNDLTLAEMAYLAAIPNEPDKLSPWSGTNYNQQKSQERALLVLDQMLQIKDLSGVTAEEIAKAKAEVPYVTFLSKTNYKKAPHYVDYALTDLEKIVKENNLVDANDKDSYRNKGFIVVTAVDLDVQELLESTIKRQTETEDFQKIIGAKNAAGVIIDPRTGQIVAMAGSRDFDGATTDPRFSPQHNAALEPRSTGSAIKPFVYLSAFRAGYNPGSVVPDKRLDFRMPGNPDPYFVKNYSGTYGDFGPYLTMRKGLRHSLNTAAVATFHLAGIDNYVDTYSKLSGWEGFKNEVKGPSAAIGGANVPLLYNTHAYATLGAEGVYRPLKSILEIKDSNGKVVFENKKDDGKQVIDKKYIYAINDMNKHYWLFDSDETLLKISRSMDIAGKTGTADDGFGRVGDVTFMAYTPTVAIGMWAGNSCGPIKCPLEAPAPTGEELYKNMFKQFLEQYSPQIQPGKFTKPSGITQLNTCIPNVQPQSTPGSTTSASSNKPRCSMVTSDLFIQGPYDFTPNLSSKNRW